MDEHPLTADLPPNLLHRLDIRIGTELNVAFPEDRIRVFRDQ